MKRTTSYSALTREATLLLGSLAYLAERSTDPDRIERIINRAYQRWQRRAERRQEIAGIAEKIIRAATTQQPIHGYERLVYAEARDIVSLRRLQTTGLHAWRLWNVLMTIEMQLIEKTDEA